MPLAKLALGLVLLLMPWVPPLAAEEDVAARAAEFRALLGRTARLPLRQTEIRVRLKPGWALDFTSSLAIGGGAIYLFQRGAAADPIIAIREDGQILRSWGAGLFDIPHSIRVDSAGNVWTVDAGNSKVHKFSKDGERLLEIEVGGIPAGRGSRFGGATDIAFAPDGRLFIADGYANARILVYSPAGELLREWGKPGNGPGEFQLPHGIAIDADGIVYVADRENGRIQRFDLDGNYIGEWRDVGKPFSLTVTRAGELWAGSQPHDTANGVEPWLLKVDKRTGRIIGCVESGGHHSVDVNAAGEPLTGARPDKILWFRSTAQ